MLDTRNKVQLNHPAIYVGWEEISYMPLHAGFLKPLRRPFSLCEASASIPSTSASEEGQKR